MNRTASKNKLSVPEYQVIIDPNQRRISLQLQSLWQFRELLYFLIWRDIKIRYKQTLLGVAWIILQPVVSMLIFTILFGIILEVPSGDIPYPIFIFAGLIPWNYFASSLSKSSISLVGDSNLITKVYFPRLIIPLASVLSGLVDVAISFIVFIPLLIYFQVQLSLSVLLLPFFLSLGILTAFGFGLWLSALNVRFRDINYIIPFLIQIWMYLTPVIYSSSLIPERFRFFRFLLAINPMTVVVEGFRLALFNATLSETQTPGPVLLISVLIILIVLITGMLFFNRTERTFADII